MPESALKTIGLESHRTGEQPVYWPGLDLYRVSDHTAVTPDFWALAIGKTTGFSCDSGAERTGELHRPVRSQVGEPRLFLQPLR